MSPFMGLSLMDDAFFAPQFSFGGMNGFTSLSTFNDGGGGGNMKRTSTSTTFINGKKVMTKK